MFEPQGAASTAIEDLINLFKPRKIVETGTFMGTGSTTIIARALKKFDYGAQFYSIECNPAFVNAAHTHLIREGLRDYVQLLQGLSIPRKMLPSRDEILQWLDTMPRHLFDDLQRERQAADYVNETSYDGPDDLLRQVVVSNFGGELDLALLDSAGYLGHIEFKYLLSLLKPETEVIFILDDAINHVKHYHSRAYLKERGKLIFEVEERYGVVGYQLRIQGGDMDVP